MRLRHPKKPNEAVSYSLYQAVWGILLVAVPVFVVRELGPQGRSDFVVGLLWALSGFAAGVGALIAGKLFGTGRDREIIGIGASITALAVYPISAAHLGLFGLSLGLALVGFLAGPIDVGVLTLRQRHRSCLARSGAHGLNEPESLWSSAGSAIGGFLVSGSLTLGFACSAILCAAAALLALLLIPENRRVVE